MLLKTQNMFLQQARLPFDIVKGSVGIRNNKADKYWKRFLNEYVKEDNSSIDYYKKCIDKVLEPNKINYNILPEKGEYSGRTGVNVFMTPHENGGLYINHYGYKLSLPIDEATNLIKNPKTAAHEARHLFDYLFQPKIAALRAKYLVNNRECDADVDDLRTNILETILAKFKKNIFEKNANDIIDSLPKDVAIEALQKCKYSLKTEKNAYKGEILYLLKTNPLKNINEILCTIEFYRNCHFQTRIKFVETKLKTLISQVREDIRKEVESKY